MSSTANDLFENMRKSLLKSIPESDRENYKKLGEKFHHSFNVMSGTTEDWSTISMEEALAYVVESLKSGLHPSFLTEDERAMLVAGYGEKWYENWGYKESECLPKKVD
jgi:lipoate-protein ligase A